MNLEEFNRRLEENNANLIAVSDYMGRNNKIYVKCKKCNNLMGHKTPFTWLYGSSIVIIVITYHSLKLLRHIKVMWNEKHVAE